MEDAGPGSNKLNAPTYLIKQGQNYVVAVPVLLYKPGQGAQGEGYAKIEALFRQGLVAEFQAIELTGNWCSVDPHNTNDNLSGFGEDDDDEK